MRRPHQRSIEAAPIYGDDDPNVIHGDPAAPNEIWGYGGDDTLFGGGAADTLIGGVDDDRLNGRSGADELYGGDGDDRLNGGGGDDRLYDGEGTDRLLGGAGRDNLFVESYEVSAHDVWDGGRDYDRVALTAASGGAIDLTGVRITSVEELALAEDETVTITMRAAQLAAFQRFVMTPAQAASVAHGVTLTNGGKIDLVDGANFTIPTLTLADANTRLDLTGTNADIGRVVAGAGDDAVLLGSFGGAVLGGGGDDLVRGGAVACYADGGADDDTLIGSAENDVLGGGAGSDVVRGGGGDDVLFGYDGASREPAAFDQLDGGAGDDQIFASGPSHVLCGDGDDLVRGDVAGARSVDAGGGDDYIELATNALASATFSVVGGDGDDVLEALGNDYDSPIDLTGATIDVEEAILDAAILRVAQIEALQTLRAYDLYLGDGGALDLTPIALPGDYLLIYPAAAGNVITLGPRATSITVLHGAGDDVVVEGGGSTQVLGDEGDDTVVIAATTGRGYFDGEAGADTLDCSTGGAVTVDLAGGTALRAGSTKADQVYGYEIVIGSGVGDRIAGGYGGDDLRGGTGADVLDGGQDGDDTLAGGSGADTLTGGTGADRFVFAALADFGRGGALDVITDFSHADGDRIDLSAIDPGSAAGDQGFTFVGTAPFSGDAATSELRCTGSAAAGFRVEIDLDHDRVADYAFTVASATAPVEQDFVL